MWNWGLRNRQDISASPSPQVLTEFQEQFLGLQGPCPHTLYLPCEILTGPPESAQEPCLLCHLAALSTHWAVRIPLWPKSIPISSSFPSPYKLSHLPLQPSHMISSYFPSFRKSSQITPLTFLFSALTPQHCSLKLVSLPRPQTVHGLRTEVLKVANVC